MLVNLEKSVRWETLRLLNKKTPRKGRFLNFCPTFCPNI